MTSFEVSVTNTDGTVKKEDEEPQQDNGKKKKGPFVGKAKSNAAKIKFLLDQRKPPTEKLPSLCQQYDDELNPITV